MPPGNHNQPHNPYASATGAYGTNAQKNASDPRETEARVLLKSAQLMQDLQGKWQEVTKEVLEEILKYNRSIWMMFYDTAVGSEDRPNDLRNNIFNLANFVFKRELDILAAPEGKKLDILIKINRDIAAGLLSGVKNAPMEDQTANVISKEPAQKESAGGWDSSA